MTTDAEPLPRSRPEPDEAEPHFDTIDAVYALLRVAALLAGLAYTFLTPMADAPRADVTIVLGAFGVYTIVAYVGGWTLFSTRYKGRFYGTAAALDFGFVVLVMMMTGGGASPMYRAMYVWVAILAFYFGQKGGNVAAAVAFVAYAWFFTMDEVPWDAWTLAVKAGGLLMHGTLIGWLVDRERRRNRELVEARREVERLRGDR